MWAGFITPVTIEPSPKSQVISLEPWTWALNWTNPSFRSSIVELEVIVATIGDPEAISTAW